MALRRENIIPLLMLCLLAAPAVYAQTADPDRRPDFSLPDLDGRERAISEWDGKAVLLNFWASWCIPCLREIPLLNELASEHAARDFQVLGIAVDTPENVRAFLEKTDMAYPTLVEEDKAQDLANELSGSFLVLPFSVFLDHQGRIFWMKIEELDREEAGVILAHMFKVRSGELGYEEAQERLAGALRDIAQARRAGQQP